MTMPVSSCEAERSFSALRRIKNYMRTKTGQARLSSLTLFHLERDILNDVMRDDINTPATLEGKLKNSRDWWPAPLQWWPVPPC